MKFGLIPLCQRGRIDSPAWTRSFLAVAEQRGVESVWMPEHVVMAVDYEPLYEYSDDGRAPIAEDTVMPDPLHWLTFAAACTDTLQLCTGVLIGPQHSAAILAKRLATLDCLSGGRLQVGLGIGWQREEYQAVGVPYQRRGQRLDELIDAMRALWCDNPASFCGDFVDFSNVVCDTRPVRPGGVPLHIGGSSAAAAKRAGLRGNGFFPYVISPEAVAARLEELRATAIAARRPLPQDFPVTVWPASYRPGATFDVGLARAYRDAGVTRLVCTAAEAGEDTDLPAIDQFIGRYQDSVMGAL
ncbi:LLM class F420-dependent oxidoreductase [Parahaliea mediterranea]|uniref:LLM class F420-dependent oxidoreductase n=1 Tax=Parahaliea mediterranea TaxID=651086 RepID=UPI000E2FF255|nr:LLM class F420-dependent oxidoreductase [Parahaliea mediterranea]